jgi:GDP-D-mannose 3',5'-epimerase
LHFKKKGFTNIRAVDKKPLYEWYLHVPGVQNLCLDVSIEDNCKRVCEGAVEVYNLAADMGGMGFIERFRVECLRSILINTHMVEAAYRAGARRYFYSSSACAYNTLLQQDPNVRALEGIRRVSGDGRARLRLGEIDFRNVLPGILARARHEDGIARFHNVYGPHGTWDGGREKAPAALCRKVIEAIDTGKKDITIWGNGTRPAASCILTTACRALTRSRTATI